MYFCYFITEVVKQMFTYIYCLFVEASFSIMSLESHGLIDKNAVHCHVHRQPVISSEEMVDKDVISLRFKKKDEEN